MFWKGVGGCYKVDSTMKNISHFSRGKLPHGVGTGRVVGAIL